MLAAIDGAGYKIVLLLHILAVIVGFAPAFFAPVLMRLSAEGDTNAADALEKTLLRYSINGITLAGVLGFGLVGMSDKLYTTSQTWVLLAVILWAIALFAVVVLIRPALKKWTAGDQAARGRVMMGTGVLHLVLVLTIIDMIWKPGFSV